MRFITQVFFSAGRLSDGASSLFHYLAASTLGLAELKEGIRHSWQGYNTREADLDAGLTLWEKTLIERFVAPGTSHANCSAVRLSLASWLTAKKNSGSQKRF